MPIYSFKNTKTGEETEKMMKIADRELYLSENPDLRQFISKAPALGDAARLGITKTPDSFNSLLKNIHKNSPGSKMQTR